MKVIVCGAGQVGTTIARHLARENIDVTVIDIDEEQVHEIDQNYEVRGITGHASYPSVLKKAGAKNADMLIAVTRSDEVNMVACQVAYSLFNVKHRIARLRHAGYLAQHETGLYAAEHMPIDVIISPELEIADGIERRLKTPGAFDMVPLAGDKIELLGIHTLSEDAPVIGMTIEDISTKCGLSGATVLAVLRKGRCFTPDAHDEIALGDDVYVLANTNDVDAVMAAFSHDEKEARRIVIVGGGNVGLHLARNLRASSRKLNLKVIERNPARAKFAARELGEDIVVLNGDALDRVLLNEAGIGSADTVITVTDDDETNIFAAVLAKEAGCSRAITLVNKRSYEALLPTLGIDAVVNPSTLTISTVLRHIRHDSISALYTLREDFGEVIEAEITSSSRLKGQTLHSLELPRGMKIGAIIRGEDVIFPQDEIEIREGDRVVALVAYSALRLAEALLGAKKTRFR